MDDVELSENEDKNKDKVKMRMRLDGHDRMRWFLNDCKAEQRKWGLGWDKVEDKDGDSDKGYEDENEDEN